ncbi:glycoside hydrolase family 140 protein [Sphingomonas sp. NIBR02145]|uniref:glycoside hydrolase family 140 protein n=1 Tax=Sphingomonas sp. NIBR02145 TaxID=3014784 RepID=UPI0022B42CD0|nr:glycoside hydrolase family 140 protein [Sphingomonas sp. NIBR02145]WHU04561.1 glycoside hydrolase family 140 protein [Sphingomonas sp. NIBR02145]
MHAGSFLLAALAAAAAVATPAAAQTPPLSVAPNGHYLLAGGKPFFWMGDTGWLLLSRTSRAEAEQYLLTRKRQGFNVVQIMVLHTEKMTNPATGPALVDGDPGRPRTTPGNDPARAGEYDYWDHLDWVAKRAEELGIYLALVPCWGSIADGGKLNLQNAPAYGRFLAERYRNQPNIIWLNGGDTRSEMRTAVWDALGSTIKLYDPGHLMTFHPIGRTDSSWQYHDAPWLDFNMFQSGHRSYAQEGASAIGEDNWRYVATDWIRLPTKPVIDGEPSYEGIPHGLHEANQPRWLAPDARRYAWWAVMAGAFGHTYGENHVMQFFTPGADTANFEPVTPWQQAIEAPGANQMQYLRRLIESRPMLERVPDPSLITDNGTRYDRVLASRGKGYVFVYTYTGRPFTLRLGTTTGKQVSAHWYSPRDGQSVEIGTFNNTGQHRFDPPGETAPGNDWVLVLDDARTPRAGQ